MSKKAIKIITVISFLLIMIVIASLSYSVFANFNPGDYKPASMTNAQSVGKIQTIANKIIGQIRIVGSILSIAMLVVIGIKYILGSVEEKAEYKKTMKPYIIGAIMVFGITNLLTVLVDIIQNVNNNV